MPQARSMNVLVVDDQATIRALVRHGLRELGFVDISEAEDGEAGLRSALTQQPPPKLIISDYNMPKLDGISLLRAVRIHPATKAIPFIMLTGQAEHKVVASALQYGVNNFLTKPFVVSTLRDKLEAVVGTLS